jgi:hypothetical protein
MELSYDPKSKSLSLIYDETSVGHQRHELRFDPQATRALFDVLIEAAKHLGGPIGAEVIEQRKLQ